MLHATRTAEKPKASGIFSADEIKQFLPEQFLERVKLADEFYRTVSLPFNEHLQSVEQTAEDLSKEPNKLKRLGKAVSALSGLLVHGLRTKIAENRFLLKHGATDIEEVAIARLDVECESGDPEIPGTYAKILYNPKLALPQIKGEEHGVIDFEVGSYVRNPDGSRKVVGTDYDRVELDMHIKNGDGRASLGHLNMFRSISMAAYEDEGVKSYETDKTPTLYEFRFYAAGVMALAKETAEGKFQDLREFRFASWGSPHAREMPDGLEPIIGMQAVTEKWSGNPFRNGPGGMGN